MIYNPIHNTNNRPIQLNERTSMMNGRRSLNNIQRRVTFADQLHQRHTGQVIQPAHKQMYHFTYGQPNNQLSQKNILTQSVYRTYSPHIQTFQHVQPRHSFPSNSFISHETNRQSTGKRRLKIFPQQFDINKQQAVIIQTPVAEQKQSQTYQQVKYLKSEIQKLKLQIRNLSQNISRNNTSMDFTSQSQIHKHQMERTRRLSQLNEFNEKLYSQLALKLKQISQKEYDNYVQQSNKKLLDEIFQSAAKSKSYEESWEKQKKLSANQNFMDIRQFQHEYQQKYNSTGASDHMHHHFDFVPQNPPSSSDGMIISPLQLYENQLKKQSDQAFTFHKQGGEYQQRHFRKSRSRVDNYELFTLDGNRKDVLVNKVGKLPSFEVVTDNKIKNTENTNVNKSQKRIEDFNRQLEGKILRKRFNSQYTTINKKKIYS